MTQIRRVHANDQHHSAGTRSESVVAFGQMLSPLEQVPRTGTRWMLQSFILGVNVVGALQMVRVCLLHLKATRSAIVIVSSIAGALGIGSSVPVHRIEGRSQLDDLHLACTLAPEIRVTAVCPGLMTARWFGEGVGQKANESIKQAYEQVAPMEGGTAPGKTSLKGLYGLLPEPAR